MNAFGVMCSVLSKHSTAWASSAARDRFPSRPLPHGQAKVLNTCLTTLARIVSGSVGTGSLSNRHATKGAERVDEALSPALLELNLSDRVQASQTKSWLDGTYPKEYHVAWKRGGHRP